MSIYVYVSYEPDGSPSVSIKDRRLHLKVQTAYRVIIKVATSLPAKYEIVGVTVSEIMIGVNIVAHPIAD